MGPEGPFGPKGEKGMFGDIGMMGAKGYRGEMGVQGFRYTFFSGFVKWTSNFFDRFPCGIKIFILQFFSRIY